MFLALSPVIAAGRALFAFTVAVLSMSGHAAVGHHHLDVSRMVLAFLLLLATAWRSNDPRSLLTASALAQCLVHGGIRMESVSMFAMHAIGTVLAFFLIWKFEELWLACMHALQPLLQMIRIAPPAMPVSLAALLCIPWKNPLRNLVKIHSLSRRGPPALALV